MILAESTETMHDSDNRRTVDRRIWFLVGFMVLALLGVLARFAQLQLLEHGTYAARAENNRVRLRAIAPNRGLILDRNGRVLAENRPAYRLVMVPERVPDIEATLDTVDGLVGLSDPEREQLRLMRLRNRPFQPVTIKGNLDEQQVAILALDRHHLPGLDIEPYLIRHYPYGEALAHVLGYVARLDESDLNRLDADNYRATTHTGKTGIERYYETRLHGKSGVERVETNAQGRMVRILERTPPVPGRDLQLTLDLDLQLAAIEALGEHPGAVVALDIETGGCACAGQQTRLRPEPFRQRYQPRAYRALLESPRRPLFNRFLAGGYEPGSTVKPFIALAGLDTGRITPETRVFSSGSFRLPGHSREYKDWREGGHGWVDLQSALEQSVNVFFYDLAHNLGIDRISRELALFGFGQTTGIDLPGEFDGVLPSRSWKRRTLNQAWFPGETVITGIGQGFIVVTPLQLAHAAATLAGRGRAAPPRLVDLEPPAMLVEHGPRTGMRSSRACDAVVHGARGTARAIAPEIPVEIGGKTGTSQVFGRPDDEAEVEPEEFPWFLRNHALFIAFAPYENPAIAVAVVAEHGGGGSSVAAPVAAGILARAMRDQP